MPALHNRHHRRAFTTFPIQILSGIFIFFEYARARFQCVGIMLYVAPLLDLFLNYSLPSMICWMR